MRTAPVVGWVSRHVKYLIGIGIATVVGALSTAVVMAAIPASDGTINACYTTGVLGNTRLMDSTSTACAVGETALTWKQGGSATGVLRPDVAGKNLSGSQMVYWDLRNMDLSGTNFASANMSGVDLRQTTLTNTNFTNTSLTGANLGSLNLSGTIFHGANLTDATLTGTTFSGTDLSYANLEGQNLSGFNLAGVSNFEGVVIGLGNMSNATLPANPNFKNAGLYGTNLTSVDFSGGNLAGANLTGANMTSANVSNVTWVEDPAVAICPDGTYASDNGDTCIGHL